MKQLRLILMGCFFFGFVSAVLGYDSGNVLSNGGFETDDLTESANDAMGRYPWFTGNSGGNAIAATGEKTHGGSYSLLWHPIGWNVKDDKTVEDAGTFLINRVGDYVGRGAVTARLSGFVDTSALDPTFRIQVILANDAFTRYTGDAVLVGGAAGWQRFDTSLAVTDSDSMLFVAFMAQGTKGIGAGDSKVYFDDLSLVYTGPDAKETEKGEQSGDKVNLQKQPDTSGAKHPHKIPIGLNQVPKYRDASSKDMATELGLNFIVGMTQWLEPTPGQYVWSGSNKDDFLAHLKELKQTGFSISMTLTNVHMDQKHLPAYLKGKRFNDPYLLQRWEAYLEAFLLRYGDLIDYLNIGNEVNNYFGQHPDEWGDYMAFFRQGESVIRRLKPNMKVGVVLVESRRTFYWKQVEPYCDYLAMTYYTPCSAFGKSPTAEALDKKNATYFARTLDEAIRLAGDKKMLITEVGCATHPDIDSSPQLQAEFIEALFGWLDGKENKILGMSWLGPVDWPYEHTKQALQGYLDAAALNHEPFMKYLTSLGLKYEDGRNKPGYDVFKNAIVRYRRDDDTPTK